jgi:hypothetical protein
VPTLPAPMNPIFGDLLDAIKKALSNATEKAHKKLLFLAVSVVYDPSDWSIVNRWLSGSSPPQGSVASLSTIDIIRKIRRAVNGGVEGGAIPQVVLLFSTHLHDRLPEKD